MLTWSELSAVCGCSSFGLGVHDEGRELVEGLDDIETSTSSAIWNQESIWKSEHPPSPSVSSPSEPMVKLRWWLRACCRATRRAYWYR